MSTLTIRNVEPAVKEQLRVRAARNGRSMEAAAPPEVTRDRGGRLRAYRHRKTLPIGGRQSTAAPQPVRG